MKKVNAREYQANVLKLQEENFELKMQLSDITQRLQMFVQSKNLDADVAKTIADQQSMIQSLRERISDLSANGDKPRSALLIAENELAKARELLSDDGSDRCEDLEKQIVELKKQNDDLAVENMSLRDRIEELEGEFASRSPGMMSSKSSSKGFSVSSKAPSESAGDPYDLRSPFTGANDWKAKCKELEDEIAQCLETNKQLSTELAKARIRNKKFDQMTLGQFQRRFNEMVDSHCEHVDMKFREFEETVNVLQGTLKEFVKASLLSSSGVLNSDLDAGTGSGFESPKQMTNAQNPLLAFLTEPGRSKGVQIQVSSPYFVESETPRKVTFTMSSPQTNEARDENYVPSPILKKRNQSGTLATSSPQASERQANRFAVSSPKGVDITRTVQTALSSPKTVDVPRSIKTALSSPKTMEKCDSSQIYQALLDTVWTEFCGGKPPEFELLDADRVALLISVIQKKMREMRRQIDEAQTLSAPIQEIIRATRRDFRTISDRLHMDHEELMGQLEHL